LQGVYLKQQTTVVIKVTSYIVKKNKLLRKPHGMHNIKFLCRFII